MSRRPPSAPTPPESRRMGRQAGSGPFAVLADLNARQRRDGTIGRMERTGEPVPAADEEVGLFQRAVLDVKALRGQNQAEIEPVRPLPLPRPRVAVEQEEARPKRRALDPLQAAYQDVIPLRDSGRVLLAPTPRRSQQPERNPALPRRPLGGSELAALLPADAAPETLLELMMRGIRPLQGNNRVELERPAPLPAPMKRVADERAALSESLDAPLSFEDRLDMGDEAAFLRPGLPRRVLSDLRRGRWMLQGQIDLHGLTRDEARSVLGQFLQTSLNQGRRCVRVIHGKGLGSPGRISILKQLSRGWLAQREEVLAFCQAGPHDGGSGALLVLLRAQNATRD